VPEAQYKLALSYYELSPRAPLDQQYTRKAIDEFQSFVEYYPNNPLVKDAAEKIRELNTRLAKKQYETAKLYSGGARIGVVAPAPRVTFSVFLETAPVSSPHPPEGDITHN
jgi:outer membrane protein assembly factor BamD